MTELELHQLDRLLAERIMGWHMITSTTLSGTHSYWWTSHNHTDKSLFGFTTQWHPTENVEQAVMIAEELRQDGWGYTLGGRSLDELVRAKLTPTESHVVRFRHIKSGCLVDGMGDTLALAICRAAEKVIETVEKGVQV